ncbi:MAG: helix-turn-helix domain-containing protein [Treponema sp.]|jgi:transcriptional regulator with XRE-family HTH domain|nr:helix-turn-helix domain-containing protein [Treponema sp.]
MGNTVKNRIIAVRNALGLTQKAISKGMYVSQSYYANIEQGSRPVNDRIIALLCSQYGVSKEYLVNGTGEMFSNNLADIQLNQLLEIFAQLNPLFRDYILLQVQSLFEVQNKQAGHNSTPKGKKLQKPAPKPVMEQKKINTMGKTGKTEKSIDGLLKLK